MNNEKSISEMHSRLNVCYQNAGGKFWSTLVRYVEDPLRRTSASNHLRLNPVLLLLLVLSILTLTTFLAFNAVPQ
jgi:hypothetical protein